VLDVRQTFPDGGYQRASLSAPVSGPISSLSVGPSGLGDALLAFQEGLSSTSEVAVAYVQVPPHEFLAFAPLTWVGPRGEVITWQAGQNVIGPVTYAVAVDGRVRVRGLYGLSYRISPRGLGAGVHRVRVIATDSAGEETFSPVAKLKVDPSPPRVHVRQLGGDRFEVTVRDRASGVHARSTVSSVGDGTPSVRGKQAVVHSYVTPGLYRITVDSANNVGIHGVDERWVQAR
jgi:hypothetical protein